VNYINTDQDGDYSSFGVNNVRALVYNRYLSSCAFRINKMKLRQIHRYLS